MKKYLFSVLVVLLTLTMLCACGTEQGNEAETSVSEDTTVAVTTEPIADTTPIQIVADGKAIYNVIRDLGRLSGEKCFDQDQESHGCQPEIGDRLGQARL